jgi:hypothetical protein
MTVASVGLGRQVRARRRSSQAHARAAEPGWLSIVTVGLGLAGLALLAVGLEQDSLVEVYASIGCAGTLVVILIPYARSRTSPVSQSATGTSSVPQPSPTPRHRSLKAAHEVDAETRPLSKLQQEQEPTCYEADDRFVASIMDPVLDGREEEGDDGPDALLSRLIDALDGSLAEARDAADRVATAVRSGSAPAPDDLGTVVAFGRRFVVASKAADVGRRAAGLSSAESATSLDSLLIAAKELVEFQEGLALQMRLRQIGEGLGGPSALAGSIAEVRASANRLAHRPTSDITLTDGLLALADLIELGAKEGAWLAIDVAERRARTALPDDWGRVVVAAVQGRLRLESQAGATGSSTAALA